MNKNKAHLISVPVCANNHLPKSGREPRLAVVSAYETDLKPEDAAGYIADLLASLQTVAAKANLDMLSDLIHVAKEEAKLHCRSQSTFMY